MKTYDCTASCLVDSLVLHHYVRAKNEKRAWLKGYVFFNYHVCRRKLLNRVRNKPFSCPCDQHGS